MLDRACDVEAELRELYWDASWRDPSLGGALDAALAPLRHDGRHDGSRGGSKTAAAIGGEGVDGPGANTAGYRDAIAADVSESIRRLLCATVYSLASALEVRGRRRKSTADSLFSSVVLI